MKKIILGLFLIVLVYKLQSQTAFVNGYVITNEGDTLPGKLQIHKNNGFFKLKFFEIAQVLNFSANDVLEYEMGDLVAYRSIRRGQQKEFVGYIVNGQLGLLHSEKENLFYVRDTNGKILELTENGSNNYKKTLKSVFKDAASFEAVIDDLSFNVEELQQLFEIYHTKQKLPYKTYKGYKQESFFASKSLINPRTKLSIGIFYEYNILTAKYGNSFGSINELIENTYGKSNFSSLGLYVNYRLFKNIKGVSLQAEAIYTKFMYKSFFTSDNINQKYLNYRNYYESKVENEYINIPLLVKYTFENSTKIEPFVSVGYSFQKLLSSDYEVRHENKKYDEIQKIYIVKSDYIEMDYFPENTMYFASLGFNYKLSAIRKINFALTYRTGTGNSFVKKDKTADMTMYSLRLGINL